MYVTKTENDKDCEVMNIPDKNILITINGLTSS